MYHSHTKINYSNMGLLLFGSLGVIKMLKQAIGLLIGIAVIGGLVAAYTLVQ
ncbi:MAG: hypothetical protein CFH08_01612 [Alphaproteobacteria bacterium MarineAlpha3_Bin7]|nr:MAG: hypothetical protein CFH08_01612 [Alphaproteobacteria bacterium MarineAlpha3_Bin7]